MAFIAGHSPHRAGHEPGDLGEYRGKLISFLQDSQYYVPERLLTRFPLDGELCTTVCLEHVKDK